MKKLTTLLLAAGLVFAASAPASAVDLKMDGQYLFSFITGERVGTGQNFDEAGQRLRLGMTLTANENLSGYFQVQVGTGVNSTGVYDWGSDTSGNSTKIGMRQAYIDWVIPQTVVKVRMGRQLVGLPEDAFGKNAIMHPGWQGRDGIVVTSPVTDWLDLTAFWVRGAYAPAKGSGGVNYDTDKSQKSDFFSLAAAFKFDGFSFSPYVMYAALDKGANIGASTDANYVGAMGDNDEFGVLSADGNAFWAGASAMLTYFDPFMLKLSGAYGVIDYEGDGVFSYTNKLTGKTDTLETEKLKNREGWYVQGKASYKTAYGTPILGAWYGSGDDHNVQYARQDWIPTFNGRFHPTLGYSSGEFALYDTTTRHNIAGTWGVQVGVEDVSFMEDLKHKFTVTMFKGTNKDNIWAKEISPWEYMTTADTVVEFNLANTYKIYKNLTACLELAYMITDYDRTDHSEWAEGKKIGKDGWSTALSFAYKF